MNPSNAALIGCIAMAADEGDSNVIASVAGQPICSRHLEAYVSQFRRMLGCADGDAWEAWLRDNHTDELVVYAATLDYLVNFVLMRQIAAKGQISVPADEVEEQIGVVIRQLGGEEELSDALGELCVNGIQFRQGIYENLMRAKVVDKAVGAMDEPKDEEVLDLLRHRGLIGKGDGLAAAGKLYFEASAALKEERKAAAFEQWLSGYRESCAIEYYFDEADAEE